MYDLHNDTGPRAGIALPPLSPPSQSGLPLLPEAPEQPPASPCLPSSKRSRSPSSGPSEAKRSVLPKVSFAARDPRRPGASPLELSTSAEAEPHSPQAPSVHLEQQQQQQQQQQQRRRQQRRRQSTDQCPGHLAQSAQKEQGQSAEQDLQHEAGRNDGRYRLPPQLRKAGGSHWIRGYTARPKEMPGQAPSYTYQLNLRQTVRGYASIGYVQGPPEHNIKSHSLYPPQIAYSLAICSL